MMVYLLHFDRKYKHAQHYIGFSSKDITARLRKHHNKTGARLMAVIEQAGISWRLAKVWPDGDRTLERRLKRWHGANKLCPICKVEKKFPSN